MKMESFLGSDQFNDSKIPLGRDSVQANTPEADPARIFSFLDKSPDPAGPDGVKNNFARNQSRKADREKEMGESFEEDRKPAFNRAKNEGFPLKGRLALPEMSAARPKKAYSSRKFITSPPGIGLKRPPWFISRTFPALMKASSG